MPIETLSRRRFIEGALSAGTVLTVGATGAALAQDFPSRNMSVLIPTGEGGGSDRDGRIFTSIWQKYLDTNFEFSYFPGAAGQVGYETYINRTETDGHDLLFSFMGAEVVMLALQAPHIEIGRDIVYIQQILSEPMAVWTAPDSPITSLEQLVDEGKKRPVNVSVARLPHPSSIGMLALGEATGAQFNLIPYGGGGPAAMATITGEAEVCALALTTSLSIADNAQILGIFDNENPTPDETGNAPTVNEVFGSDIPPMTSARSWAVHGRTIEEYPERVELLTRTMQQTLEDPDYAQRVEETGVPARFIAPGGQDVAMQAARETMELALRYRELLTEN